MTKLAITVPPFCASCFQAGSEKQYVDFDAAYDGPVITLEDGRRQPIDDLVICDGCLQEAFDLLDPQGMKARISALEGQVEHLEADIVSKDRQIQRLGEATKELIEFPIKRHGGSNHPDGPIPDEVKQFLRERKALRDIDRRSETQKLRKVRASQ